MSSDGVLERTRQADLQPLVVSGVPVFRMYGQIRIELLHALSKEHVELFADPNADPATGDIQWFAPFPGEIVRLADCPEDKREQYEFQLARLVDDITNHIETLHEAGPEDSGDMANVLATALEIPDESHIFVVGDRPVLSGWGHVPRGPAAPREILRALVKRVQTITPPPPPPMPPELPRPPAPPEAVAEQSPPEQPVQPTGPEPAISAEPVAGAHAHALVPFVNATVGLPRRAGLSALLWSILAGLLLVIGYFLLKYCGLGWPMTLIADRNFIVNYCAAPPSLDFRRNTDLVAQLEDLKRSLAEKRQQCTAAGPDNSKGRVTEAHGRIGAINVVLTWNTEDDLDLHVRCPNGDEIYFSDKNKCGGVLDVDKNASSDRTRTPVENVTWPEGAAPNGTYKVAVDPYYARSSPQTGPVDFKVELFINGRQVEEYNRRFERGASMLPVFEFTLPYTARRQ